LVRLADTATNIGGGTVSPRQVTILLVEDDDIDAMTITRGLNRAGIANPMVRAHDGVEALEVLLGKGDIPRLAPPYLLLIDIRMPRLDGLGLVRAIRCDPTLQRTIIFILTTSDNDRDRIAAYDAHVAGYIVKSNAPEHYRALGEMLEYYLMIVSPPPLAACG
jgi:CheY-like chemotaxis protein